MDFLFNVLALSLDLTAVGIARKRPDPSRLASILLFTILAQLFLAVVFQRNPFHLFRLWAWVVLVHLPVLLVSLGWLLRSRSRLYPALGILAVVAAASASADAFLVEPTWLRVTRHEIKSHKLDRPLRIGILADFQTDRIGDYEREVLETMARQEVDLLVLPGDYIHAAGDRYESLVEEFRALWRESGLAPPLGVYAVGGNCDHPDRWAEIFAGMNVTTFRQTATVAVNGIEITGLSMLDSFDTQLRLNTGSAFRIVFGHAPDFALGNGQADLLIAGHTHGGQIRLPGIGPLITFSRVPRAWADGLTELPGGGTLVVSRGTGHERGLAPRLRFFCRPEIAVVNVVPS